MVAAQNARRIHDLFPKAANRMRAIPDTPREKPWSAPSMPEGKSSRRPRGSPCRHRLRSGTDACSSRGEGCCSRIRTPRVGNEWPQLAGQAPDKSSDTPLVMPPQRHMALPGYTDAKNFLLV